MNPQLDLRDESSLCKIQVYCVQPTHLDAACSFFETLKVFAVDRKRSHTPPKTRACSENRTSAVRIVRLVHLGCLFCEKEFKNRQGQQPCLMS